MLLVAFTCFAALIGAWLFADNGVADQEVPVTIEAPAGLETA